MQIILSLLGTWFIDPNSSDKRNENQQNQSTNVKNQSNNVHNQPKNYPNQSKTIQKVPHNPTLVKKARYLPSNSYCWCLDLLSTRYPGAATICSSEKSDLYCKW